MAILRYFLVFDIRQLTHHEQVFWGQDWGQVLGSSNKLSIGSKEEPLSTLCYYRNILKIIFN